MNGHNDTDELLKKMGEAHQRYEASHDENALLLRALEARPARPRWAVAGWLVAALIVVGLIIRPMLPALGGGPSTEYTINGVKVRAYHSDDKNFPGTFYSFSLEDKELYIAQQPEKYPEEPLVAEVRLGGSGCILYPADVALADPNLAEAIKFKPSLDLVKDVSSQMERAKLWPADLWSIKPFVKKLARGEYRIEYSGPVNAGFVVAGNTYIGNSTGYMLQGSGLRSSEAGSLEPLMLRLYIWPDSFTLNAYAKPNQYNIYFDGNSDGYNAYQTSEWWGEGVRTDVLRIKHFLPQYLRLLPLLSKETSPEYSKAVSDTTELILKGEPSALYRADKDYLANRMEPWKPGKKDESLLEQQRKALSGLAQKFSYTFDKLTISGREEPNDVVLSEEGLEAYLISPYGHYALASLKMNGERLSTKVYMLNEGSFPTLMCEMRPELDELLNKLSNMANEALAAPADAWPKKQYPAEYVHKWLSALAGREVAVWDYLGKAMIQMIIVREGAKASFVVNVGYPNTPELNLRFTPDGFELLNTNTGYLITSSKGSVSAFKTKEAAAIPVGNENVRQLKAAIEVLDEFKEGIPSAVYPGLAELREFIGHPEVAQAKEVEKLPSVPWAGEALLDRYAQVSMGIMNLANE